jgi:hypothetical protein
MARTLFLGLLGALATFGRPAGAALVPLSFEELVEKSKLVVSGEVVARKCFRDRFQKSSQAIFTEVTIRVDTVLKGRVEGNEVKVQILGGELPGPGGVEWERCAESPSYALGERVLVFLREFDGRVWNTGWLQGKYTLGDEGRTVRGKLGLPIGADLSLSAVTSEVRLFSAQAPAPAGTVTPAPAGTATPAPPGTSTPAPPGTGASDRQEGPR